MKKKNDNKFSRETQPAAKSQRRPTKSGPNKRAQENKRAPKNPAKSNQSPKRTQNNAAKPSGQLNYTGKKGKLKVIFLGGVGEIGKNMTAFEYGNEIVVIDAGMTFPTSDMPGVDVVIPDMTYLAENRSKIKAVLLTHGHEDHIGAMPFLVEKLGGKIDVYGTKLTLGLVENKLVEHNALDKVNLITIADKSVVSLGSFSAEFIHVSHSVAGSVAICLRTPVGTILHTGDFKVDYTPLGNEIMNLNRIAEIGKQGILLLMSESTNAEKPGYTLSESIVVETMNKLFSEAKGRRIIIATFASNVDRLGMIMSLARQYKRKIAVSGRSMLKCIETAQRVGQIAIEPDLFVDIDRINGVEDGKLVILSTGSQGEPMSALTRMASGEFNKVKIGSNDTIIISATPIPGNEKDVYNVINNLYRLGAVVIYSSLADVHVSGHACQEELKLIYTLAKPRYFIPIHGEYRHLKQHSMLVEKLGQKKSHIIIPDIGDCVEVDGNTFKVSGKVQGGSVMVDGLGIGDVSNIVLKDRLSLAEDGILLVVAVVNRTEGKLAGGPEIISRGCFLSADDGNSPADEIKSLVLEEFSHVNLKNFNSGALRNNVLRTVKRYFKVKFKRNPIVIPVLLEL